MNDILSERGACGVGFIANLKNEASHKIVEDALVALGCMEHRGGCGADNDSGDGAGLMTSVPWDLYNNWADKQGLPFLDRYKTGVGMVFLPQSDEAMEEAKKGDLMMDADISCSIRSLLNASTLHVQLRHPIWLFWNSYSQSSMLGQLLACFYCVCHSYLITTDNHELSSLHYPLVRHKDLRSASK